MSKVPSLPYEKVIAALKRDGWVIVRQRGGHIRLQTKYSQAIRLRPNRSMIKDEWIQYIVQYPEKEHIQADG